MADHEKLVEVNPSNGISCVRFRNENGLSMEQITKIFSKYGEVLSVNAAGVNEYGFRFIRFRTKEQALECVRGLENHPNIRLQEAKHKSENHNNNTPPNQYRKNNKSSIHGLETNNPLHNTNQNGRTQLTNGSKDAAKPENNDFQRQNGENIGRNDLNGADRSAGKDFKTAKSDGHNPLRKPLSARLARNLPKNESDCSNEAQENSGYRLNVSKFAELYKRRGTIATTFQPSNNDCQNQYQKTFVDTPAIPAGAIPQPMIASPRSSRTSSKSPSIITDAPPPLISNPLEPKTQAYLAYDVVVANIHSNLGVSNIYEMFDKFEPIYVSDIETVPEINVRFCFVYFKTPSVTLQVEESFDGISAFGKNLIILRPETLEAEARIF
ncbi:uncharacterized protein LOC107220341 isoform X1 [Neodiprion lecontei]|uniref:Uncharacterized protein LOC107220341 n=1 Tax=Neodiprion lecontei TaxID=441921 RepID=A0A6J0BKU8_NEOLC|nr:uncharacterized protein LOC107220341 isoform X1 [Neodiprion lecontei]XP_046594545.1 uncharacterized protein LOC107220341 isoform X1 [Neodiprion lecontei]